MNINDLKCDIEIGHEIEFNLDGHNYFIQPDYEKKSSRWQEFVLYDCANPSSLIAFWIPVQRIFPNPNSGTVAPAPAHSENG